MYTMETTSASPLDLDLSPAGPDAGRSTLLGEHAILLRDLHRRVQPMVSLMHRHVWPDAELRTLARFLRTVVLRQASDEEVLLFPSGADAPLMELTATHARLHLLTDRLDQADASSCPLAQLESLVDELVTVFEAHLRDEQAILAALADVDTTVPGVAGLDQPWLAVTAEPVVIDLGTLPTELAVQWCIERVLRLRPGQSAQIRADHDGELSEIENWVRRFDSARYGMDFSRTATGQATLRLRRRTLD